MGYVNYFTIFVIVSDIQIIGIDIAPGKKSTIYDGNCYHHMSADTLNNYLISLQNDKNKTVLLCWDAPLTGPQTTTRDNYIFRSGDFTKRIIEKEYFNVPKGISVMGYASCPHWTITKFLTGYPIIGDYCLKENLPFTLVTNEETQIENGKKYIAEVHPALSIWLLMKDTVAEGYNWIYKDMNVSELNSFSVDFNATLMAILPKESNEKIVMTTPQNDDELDAYAAWLMGYLWINKINLNNFSIKLVGSKESGCIILPQTFNAKANV